MSLVDNIKGLLINNYDNDYRQNVNPYHYQNVVANSVNTIKDIFSARLKPTIMLAENEALGVESNTNTNWMIISNTESAPSNSTIPETDNEREKLFNFTIEARYIKYYTELIQKEFQLGNRIITKAFDIIDEDTYENLLDYPKQYWTPKNNKLKIFPQKEILWNYEQQKFVLVWYTPVTLEGNILPYSEVIEYLNSFCEKPNYLYSDDEDKKIILRIDNELGWELTDVILYSKFLSNEITYNELSTKIKYTYDRANEWLNEFNYHLETYLDICNFYNQNKILLATRYFYIDEDINIFEEIGNSYFLFKVKDNYYNDLVGGMSSSLAYWEKNKSYKQGQSVIRDIKVTIDEKIFYKKIIYKCLIDLDAQEDFSEILKINDEEVVVWEAINSELGDEELYIKTVYEIENFNKDDYYRFVFPSIEKYQDNIILPNGEYQINTQEGTIIFGSEAIVLYTKKNNKGNYYYSDTYYTNSKVVCYIKKKKNPIQLAVMVEFNEFSTSATILKEAFAERKDLVKVVLGSNITRIEDEAFYACTNLMQIILPYGLTTLGKKVFASCSSLVRASLPSKITELDGTYCGCTKLKTVVLSKNTKILDDYTFLNCENLNKIYNIDNIEKFGREVFYGCKSLTDFILPKKITKLPDGLFKNCELLKLVITDNKITYVGEACFENCKQLEQAISFKYLTEIKPRTYKGCSNLKEITFDYTNFSLANRIVPESYCQGCLKLRHIYWAVPEKDIEGNNIEELIEAEDNRGPRQLQNNCFKNCGSLVEVRIPSTVQRVGIYIFADCLNLKTISIPLEFQQEDSSNWGETIDIIEGRANKGNWVNSTLTKIIVRKGD